MKHKWVAVSYFVAVSAIVLALNLTVDHPGALYFVIRAAALGAIFLTFTSILSSLFLVQLSKYFGVPFLKTHHLVAITALVLMFIHPLGVAIHDRSIGVFVPELGSWVAFFAHGGRVALYLFAIAGITAFYSRRLKRYWRYIHWLTYVAFVFAVIHATILGIHFQPTWLRVIAYTMLGLVAVAFVIKRRMRHTIRNRGRKKVQK